jgi:hypothetical protein
MRKIIGAAATVAILAASGAAWAGPPPPIPKGNHYTCYPAKFTDKFARHPATVTDQMGTYKVVVTGISRVCMPARKIVDGKVFEPVDPKAHLTCYTVVLETKPKLVDVVTNDQFGVHTNVRLAPPNELCLPAGKVKQG